MGYSLTNTKTHSTYILIVKKPKPYSWNRSEKDSNIVAVEHRLGNIDFLYVHVL